MAVALANRTAFPGRRKGDVMRNGVRTTLAAVLVLLLAGGAHATGNLENPQNGATESGIAAITGWHCTARTIELRMDGAVLGNAGMGTPRADTAGVCGRSDTGFSYLYNYALLKGGTHRVDAYADGLLFASATFNVGYLGGEFLTGLAASHFIADFPSKGVGAHVVWSQPKQNYVVTQVEPLLSPSLVGTYTLRHVSMFVSNGLAMSSLAPGWSVEGTMTFRSDRSCSMWFRLSYGAQSSDASIAGTYVDSGYYVVINGETDLVVERGDTLTVHTLAPSGSDWGSVVLSATRLGPAAVADAAGERHATVLGLGSTIAQLVSGLSGGVR
jgi:hypothetical protein